MTDGLPAGLARFVAAVLGDEALQLWFERLEDAAPGARAAEFLHTACKLRDGGGDDEVAHATIFFAAPCAYEATLASIRRAILSP